jgi:hypothetical protein
MSPTQTPPSSPLQQATVPSSSKSSGFLKTFFIIIALILFGVLLGVLATRFVPMSTFSNLFPSLFPTVTPTITPAPTLEITPTSTVDDTVSWQMYIDQKYQYSFKYPSTWKDITDIREKELGNFTLESDEKERISGTIFTGTPDPAQDIQNGGSSKSFSISGQKYLYVAYAECGGKGCNISKKHLDIFIQILSTFKFINQTNANLQHSVLKDGKSSVDFPSDWQLTDKTSQFDLYQDNNLQWSQSVVISKNNYQISSSNPLAWGPGICLFPDSPDYNKEGQGTKFSTYTEFTKLGTTYRRVKTQSTSQTQTWGICSELTGQTGFGDVSGFGSTSYTTPLQYDEKILSTMDTILMSMQIKQ